MSIRQSAYVAFLTFILSINSISAQENAASTAPNEIEEIIVTGSQIKGAKITGALNVSVITGVDIEAIAADSGDVLLEHIAEQGLNYFTEAEDAAGGVNASRGDNSLTLLNG